MKTVFEFRVFKENAMILGLPIRDGWPVSIVYCQEDDEIYSKIKSAEKIQAGDWRPVYSSWDVVRQYTDQEYVDASAFLIKITSSVDIYSRDFGANFGPTNGLYDLQQLPVMPEQRGKNSLPQIWRFNSGEIVCNEKCAEILKDEASIQVIPLGRRGGPPFLIDVPGQHLSLSANTIVGEGPFDYGHTDPSRDIVGLNIISEAHLQADTLPAPWSATRQRVGIDLNELRARRLVLVKPEVRKRLISAKVRGVKFEIARLDGF